MAHFSFKVDTAEMADSIDGVSRHVDGVTAAVVAMESAVIAAEVQGADKICQNVNFGFYSLIKSQVSQKLAKHKSTAEAKLMELEQQSSALLAIRTRMEKDFNMIASRYTKLFDSLNKGLKSRVFELDRPTTDFVFKDVAKIDNRPKRLAASPSINQTESIISAIRISASNTKFHGRDNVMAMKGFVRNSETQRELVESILTPEKVEAPTVMGLPVIIGEVCDINIKESTTTLTVPRVNREAEETINSSLQSYLTEMRWQPSGSDTSSKVKREFSLMVLESGLPDRVKRTMGNLLSHSGPWMNLERTRQ